MHEALDPTIHNKNLQIHFLVKLMLNNYMYNGGPNTEHLNAESYQLPDILNICFQLVSFLNARDKSYTATVLAIQK